MAHLQEVEERERQGIAGHPTKWLRLRVGWFWLGVGLRGVEVQVGFWWCNIVNQVETYQKRQIWPFE